MRTSASGEASSLGSAASTSPSTRLPHDRPASLSDTPAIPVSGGGVRSGEGGGQGGTRSRWFRNCVGGGGGGQSGYSMCTGRLRVHCPEP